MSLSPEDVARQLKQLADENVVLRSALADLIRRVAELESRPAPVSAKASAPVAARPVAKPAAAASPATSKPATSDGEAKQPAAKPAVPAAASKPASKVSTPEHEAKHEAKAPASKTPSLNTPAAAAAASSAPAPPKSPVAPAKKAEEKKSESKPVDRAAQVGDRLTKSAVENKAKPKNFENMDQYRVGTRKVFVERPDAFKGITPSDEAPASDLQLDFIYGFNGNFRNNIGFTSLGDLVYAIAATGVVWDYPNAQKFITPHDEDISSFALHPNREIVATGQRDPKGKSTPYIVIWNVKTLQPIAQISYHERAVAALSFSVDGTKLISMGDDNDHTAAVWDWQKDTKKPLFSIKLSKDDIFALKAIQPQGDDTKDAKEKGEPIVAWVSYGVKHLLVTTIYSNKGKLDVLQRKPSTMEMTKTVQQAYHSIVHQPSGGFLAGTHDGNIYVFDAARKLVKVVKVTDKPVSALALTDESSGDFVAATYNSQLKFFSADFSEKHSIDLPEGAQPRSIDYFDGKLVIGTKTGDIILTNEAEGSSVVAMQGHTDEVWALAAHPTQNIIAVGAHDKSVRLWNTQTKEPIATVKLSQGASSACFSPDGSLLVIGQKDGNVTVVNTHDGSVVVERKVHKENVSAVAFYPKGHKILTAGWDQVGYILEVQSLDPKAGALKGHTASISSVGISEDGQTVVTCSTDYELLYWDGKTGKRLEKAEPNTRWFTYNCLLGWSLQGVFVDGQDGTDNNAISISGSEDDAPESRLVASGTDSSEVRLFQFPVLHNDAKYKTFPGHSSHVTSVRFSPDGQWLYSTGGNDLALFQWKVVRH